MTGCVYEPLLEPLRRTLHSFSSSLQQVHVDHGRAPTLMAAQCLNGQNLSAAFEQELDERVSQRGTQLLALMMPTGLSGMNFRVPGRLLDSRFRGNDVMPAQASIQGEGGAGFSPARAKTPLRGVATDWQKASAGRSGSRTGSLTRRLRIIRTLNWPSLAMGLTARAETGFPLSRE